MFRLIYFLCVRLKIALIMSFCPIYHRKEILIISEVQSSLNLAVRSIGLASLPGQAGWDCCLSQSSHATML